MTAATVPQRNKNKTLAGGLKVFVYALLILWGTGQLFPVFYLFNQSFKTRREIVRTPLSLPESPQFQNWGDAWFIQGANTVIGTFMINSVIVVSIGLILLLFVSALAAYGLARYTFPGKGSINVGLLLSLAVPIHALIIPLWVFFRDLGMRNSLFWLAVLYCVTHLAFSILILRAYFASFPRELEEAARIDGASDFTTFWRVVMPVSKGALSSVAVLNVLGMWNELLLALIMLDRTELRTVPLALIFFQGEYSSDITLIFAGMSMLTVPSILFYLIFQQQITKGMTTGAVK